MEAINLDDTMTAEEVAPLLKITVKTLNQMCCDGRVPAVKVGRNWIFYTKVIDAFLRGEYAKQRKAPKPEGELWQSTKEVKVKSGTSALKSTDSKYTALLKQK
jgi:excisionase family DNA binding protein